MMLAAGEEVGEMESLNMSFVGAPGTAKTSMARDVGEEYCGLGLLAKPDLAGYKGPLNAMLDHNVGMRSRFPVQLEFPSYTGEEMVEILSRMAASRSKVLIDPSAAEYWLRLCTFLYDTWSEEGENPGPRGEPGGSRRLIDIAANGRFARMVLTEASLLMKNRVAPTLDTTTPEGLRQGRTVIAADLREATRRTLITQRLDPSIADIA